MSAGSKSGERRDGRRKGTPNKTTSALKEAILLAAAQVGEDGAGKNGLIGYLRRVADEEVKSFTGLLGPVLPLQMMGESGGAVQILVDTGIQRNGSR